VVKWQIILSKQAIKDAEKIKASGLKNKVQQLFCILQNNPYDPPYE
jgi:Txe/YoeB family toxin of Txe-Axe toxin-antitoxin module